MATATAASLTHICPPLATTPFDSKLPLLHHQFLARRRQLRPVVAKFISETWPSPPRHLACRDENLTLLTCGATRRKSPTTISDTSAQPLRDGDDENVRRVLQLILWAAEGIYILWLFLLPYAPGDPVWAINSDTVNSLVGLSLNSCFSSLIGNLENYKFPSVFRQNSPGHATLVPYGVHTTSNHYQFLLLLCFCCPFVWFS